MKNLLVSILFLFSMTALAAPITTDQIYAPDGLTIYNKHAVLTLPTEYITESVSYSSAAETLKNKTFDVSSNVVKQLRCIYDVPALGGATDTDYTICTVPSKAVVTNVHYEVITQPVALSGDSPTVGASIAAGEDTVADTAIASLTVGQYLGKEDGTAAKMVKATSAKPFKVNVKTGGLSAGRIIFWLSYDISE